jgi:hypothetical protein
MWLNMCADTGWASRSVAGPLANEAEQLRKIFTASQITAKRRRRGGTTRDPEQTIRRSSILSIQRFALRQPIPQSAIIDQHCRLP